MFSEKRFFGYISNNWQKGLFETFGTNIYKTFESRWYHSLAILQWTNTVSVIFKWGTFSAFLFLLYFQWFQVISLFQVVKAEDNILF